MEDAVFMELCRLDEPASTSRSVWLSRASCIMNRQPCIRLWSADTIYYANQPPASLDQHRIAKAHIIRELLYRQSDRPAGRAASRNWTGPFYGFDQPPFSDFCPYFTFMYSVGLSPISGTWYSIGFRFYVVECHISICKILFHLDS